MNGLHKNEFCPIHKSRFCCGRERPKPKSFGKGITQHGPVTRVPDEHTPKGYRELCTPAEMRRRKVLKVREQDGCCGHCGDQFTDFGEVDNHHIRHKGMGSAFRDDSLDNLLAVHGRHTVQNCHGKIHDQGLSV